MNDHEDGGKHARRSVDSRWILVGFAVVAAFFLITEHRAHLYGFVPYLLLLACPLMHFMHGHDRHPHRHEPDRPDAKPTERE